MSQKRNKLKIPSLGTPVRGSKTGQPIMVLFDLIGRRWSMGILWNLSDKNCTFRELQARCDSVSPTVLNTRLKELRAVGLVTNAENGYALTQAGHELYSHLEPLGAWAKNWTKEIL